MSISNLAELWPQIHAAILQAQHFLEKKIGCLLYTFVSNGLVYVIMALDSRSFDMLLKFAYSFFGMNGKMSCTHMITNQNLHPKSTKRPFVETQDASFSILLSYRTNVMWRRYLPIILAFSTKHCLNVWMCMQFCISRKYFQNKMVPC